MESLPKTASLQDLESMFAHYSNAVEIIAHSSVLGYQAGQCYRTLVFLENIKNQLDTEIKKIKPEASKDVGPL